MITEQQLQNWARPLTDTENAKCVATVASIRKILEDHFGSKVEVFLQGSYKNKTNVRQDSDVDIVVCYKDAFFPEISNLTPQDKALHKSIYSDSSYTFIQFKNEVENLLKSKFPGYVERKNKCIRINANTYRVNADVIPCFVFKRFKTATTVEAEGIKLLSDSGDDIRSFPKQHHENGVQKHSDTNEMYKKVVRMIKNCRNHMIDSGQLATDAMPSFFVECLVWNISHHHFNKNNHKDAVNAVIVEIWNDMGNTTKANEYAEVSDLMWLFKGQTKRTHNQAKDFVAKVYALIN